MRRYELTDEQWAQISKFFPQNEGQRGGQWRDHRQVLNGMLWILSTGAPWRDLPERYGPWKTVYDRFRRYRISGLLDEIVEYLQIQLDEEGYIDWELWMAAAAAVDSTVIRAHKSAAGASKKGARANVMAIPMNP
ncbi:IS5 family transposase [Catalinimonas alkaloidigena]|uniref:IS5 family transposase n=1 Tax=Catalinimonas alkaloidigena TaxID=1075417 RepID=UPI000B7ECC35|nr:IS5 family transposase [Catalinimonas alkaloidigena]